MLTIRPILSALRHHKAGTILIALQIALTLAIVCNALFVIRSRIERISRDTGIAETELMTVNNRWVGKTADYSVQQATDLATLRALPGVADAYATNAFPLLGGGWGSGIRRLPASSRVDSGTSIYFVDEHAIPTLGLKLIAGRNFTAGDVGKLGEGGGNGTPDTPTIIVTRALAEKAYPEGALGKTLYLGNIDARPSTIIGIVDRLQSPYMAVDEDPRWQNVVMVPLHLTSQSVFFVIRARPGQLQPLLKSVPQALAGVTTRRVIPQPHGVLSFTQIREMAYSSDRGLAWLMGGICVILLVVTAAGIVGLTSFWVGQRRRQIGIRRALGATRRDIMAYFLTENMMISVAGVVAGVVLAFCLNQWMMLQFETARLTVVYVGVGAVVLLLLGQLAVLAPALRASHVPPVEATRTI